MLKKQILPDFITVDGGEGGTGAAPVEFSNSLGMPLREGLHLVNTVLIQYNLRSEIKLIASGKILTGFHMARAFALGADLCNSARAMMMAVGCIQALQCNTNTCPVGVATQNKSLMKGLTRIIHEFPIPKPNCLPQLRMLEICYPQKWATLFSDKNFCAPQFY